MLHRFIDIGILHNALMWLAALVMYYYCLYR